MSLLDQLNKKCPHCHGLIAVRNPTGKCDHLYYPENCRVCKKREKQDTPTQPRIWFRVVQRGDSLDFFWSANGVRWQASTPSAVTP